MLTDAELVDGVVAGYDDAFAQLYERHSLAAWRLGQTVTGNADDAADAVSEAFARVLVAVRAGHLDKGGSFRSYLLTATRNAALDNIRKTSRTRPTEQEQLSEVESTSPTPSELLTHDEEAALVAEAFRNLPERWRSVLWLTEVEGVATKDAAQRLGLSPNGAAQLAVRARTGLRERFLQAHLRKTVDPLCRTTVDRLGAYVGGGLSTRDLAKVDQHLAGCASCEARRKELEDVGTCLRRAAVPVPLALAGTLGAAGSPVLVGFGSKVGRALAWAQEAWATKAAAAAAAGILAAGAGGAYFAGSDQAGAPVPATPAAVVAADRADAVAGPGTGGSGADGPEAPSSASEGELTPPPPLMAALPVGQPQVVSEPDCPKALVDLPGGGPLEAETDAAPPNHSADAGGDGVPGGGDDGDRTVASLGRMFEDDGAGGRPDARFGGGGGDQDPSVDVDMELEAAERAARLALAAEMASEDGLELGLDVAGRGAASSEGCDAGVGAGVEVPFSGS